MNSPSQRFSKQLQARLEKRQDAALLRTLEGIEGIDFTSNDYLNLRSHPKLAEAVVDTCRAEGTGAGASRLLRGNLPVHETLEAELARFSSREKALLFSSGFALNTGLLPAITTQEDAVFSDALNHASIIDGIRLSKAKSVIFAHQNFSELEKLLQDTPCNGNRFIVTESLFSMDGDLTDLHSLCTLAEAHNALVLIDEAHATGLYGSKGAGRVQELGLEEKVLATIHTGGKALGVGGAWVASSAPFIDYLVNFCRSFIYSTAPIPALAGALSEAIVLRAELDEAVEHLHSLSQFMRDELNRRGIDTLGSASQIIPVLLGSNERALFVANSLRQEGFDVRAIRPPTVPVNTARLRITLRSSMDRQLVNRLIERIVHYIGISPS